MPAIQPARLKKQVIELVDCFAQPPRFRSRLHDLYALYASRAHRIPQGLNAHTLIPCYELPPPVTHQVENELHPFCQADPPAALALADTLWADDTLEVRLLAIHILGVTPPSPPEAVTERLFAWLGNVEDEALLDALLEKGAAGVRRDQPALWWAKVKNWLSSLETRSQRLGLRAAASLLAGDDFHDLPSVYALISPLIYPVRPELKSALEEALQALARRSPAETVYFLKQMLLISPDPATPRLVRRCLPFFEGEWRASLQAALRTPI